MERYENLGLVGEGSYGMVLKCRHKESNQVVAIKKFIESEDDKMVKKIAMREIRMLKQLRHENLVNLLEVFRRKKRLYLVFEFVDRTVLDDLERKPDGLEDVHVKKIAFQVLRGLEFCHSHNIIHRDVKPENILISKSGIVKLCDFGFARTLATGPGEVFTDYVATRWYRAPELLVGDINYGKAVDVWAVGCLLFEMITGDPLFPGDSDIDQLFHITKHLGNLSQRHLEIFHRNPLFTGMRLPNVRNAEYLKKYKKLSSISHDLIIKSLALEASERPSCLEMIKHRYFDEGDFASKFLENLKEQIEKETVVNPLLKSIAAHKSDNNSKENKKEKRHKERQESLPKSQHDSKKKKDAKFIAKENSVYTVPHYSSVASNIETNKKTTKANDKKHNTSVEDTEVNQQSTESNQHQNNKSKSETDKTECTADRINAHVSMSQAVSDGRGVKQVDFDRSDTKLSLRMPLDVSINMLGKNLPDIGHVTNANRAHGHDVIKQTKSYKKKPHNKHADGGSLSLEHKSIEELSEKLKKESRRELSDIDLSKKSGLHLPSVTAKSMKTGQSRGSMRKHTTIPHIQNIDPFPSPGNPRESPTGTGRSHHRDGNLPAV